jgi:NADH dehydrogenase
MVRGNGKRRILENEHVEKFVVSGTNVGRFVQGMEGCEAVFNLVGIIREFPSKGVTFYKAHQLFTRILLDACKQAGIKRYLHMSVNSVDSDLKIGYNTSKLEAEDLVRDSGLNWTIFRPSIIFGPGDRFAEEFARWIKKGWPIPLIGKGYYRLSPVARTDLCRGMVKLVNDEASYGKTYHIGGPEKLNYIEILKIIEGVSGRKMRLIKLPRNLILMVAGLLGRFPWFPASKDMVKQLLYENVVDSDDFWKKTGISPKNFGEDIIEYVNN